MSNRKAATIHPLPGLIKKIWCSHHIKIREYFPKPHDLFLEILVSNWIYLIMQQKLI